MMGDPGHPTSGLKEKAEEEAGHGDYEVTLDRSGACPLPPELSRRFSALLLEPSARPYPLPIQVGIWI